MTNEDWDKREVVTSPLGASIGTDQPRSTTKSEHRLTYNQYHLTLEKCTNTGHHRIVFVRAHNTNAIANDK